MSRAPDSELGSSPAPRHDCTCALSSYPDGLPKRDANCPVHGITTEFARRDPHKMSRAMRALAGSIAPRGPSPHRAQAPVRRRQLKGLTVSGELQFEVRCPECREDFVIHYHGDDDTVTPCPSCNMAQFKIASQVRVTHPA